MNSLKQIVVQSLIVLFLFVALWMIPAPGHAADEGEPVFAGYRNGFFLRTEGGRFEFKLGGRVTAHAWIYQQGSVPNNDLFVSRARVWMNATVWKHITIRIQNDFLLRKSLRDAYADIHFTPLARLTIGQFKVPFSLEALYSHKYIDFVERPAVVRSTLIPTRDTGIMLHGKLFKSSLGYQIAMVSGAGQNVKDNNNDKDIAGRIFVAPFRWTVFSLVEDLCVGIAGTYGKQPSLTIDEELVGNSAIGITPAGFPFYAPVPVNGDRLRLNGQMAWMVGPGSLKGEYIRTSQDRNGVIVDGQGNLGDFETEGWYITASWILTGENEKETAKRPHPASPFFASGGTFGPGLIKLATRYEEYTLDKGRNHAATEPPPITFRAWTIGVTWFPVDLIRLSMDYELQDFSDSSCSPRPGNSRENVIMARFQAEF